jgi:hypothetical protein
MEDREMEDREMEDREMNQEPPVLNLGKQPSNISLNRYISPTASHHPLPYTEHAIALVPSITGLRSAEIISTLVIHPFDVVKTRLQGVSYSKHLDIWSLAKRNSVQWIRATPVT